MFEVIEMTEAELREKIKAYTHFTPRVPLSIITDTTEFMNIRPNDVLELKGTYYLVLGDEKEKRFGLEGEPKFWVKRAVDLTTGNPKIIKLVFHESFTMHLAGEEVFCFRSPQKEARVLERVKGDPAFMQGSTVIDTAGNHIRIIDKIRGNSYYEFLQSLNVDHETYFHQYFPNILKQVMSCMEAINKLHQKGEVHGDIRNDHLFIDRNNGKHTWIDFDFTYNWEENPFGIDLFGLGKILLFTIGKGFYSPREVAAWGPEGEKIASELRPEDMSLFIRHRIMNLKKLFPYIPQRLNDILLFFSYGAEVFYETAEELLEDIKECEEELAL